ncbi:uncharacterized protein LOC103315932 [Nasonia vitripennis]|uniref:Uncharacterized protein n=1 Tax=Nasonia vitripennis TaxID=7425 RepID=A0A7M7LTX4_NASVI|nr:uncharacterized protein LOC100680453 [Nasonia vitripennis]XP_031783159.1 uncharacterized protein LOC103315932 [Nasonia vitripennis]XP_031784832.1 uncharacterized protein LOC116417181 [Nasonia vitripennis]XP_032453811.1 uncharacterized protein LOC103315932 [Nasonia vitripennis]XP_032453812.1 uncharacterized protein LOC103315932 [Nasonia vitripennis]XP_032453813.1 uncharacterized protein LOC103315932 [Nasonia vitripennis]XP_032453814.1 uncharacterized protein LOC103315932 [Nasonia vitripenni
MADEEVIKILDDLGLEDLVETFKHNKITMGILPKMNETLINALIPAIGDRAVFLDFWNKNFNKNQSNEGSSEKASKKRKERNHDNASSSGPPAKKVSNEENNSIVINKPLSNSVFAVETMKPLDTLFEESDLGRQVVRKYELKNELENSDRSKVCNVIITDLVNRKIRLRNETAAVLAKMIVKKFPTEVESVYYRPPVSKIKNVTKSGGQNRSKPSGGKLMSMFRNRKHEETKLSKLLLKEKDDKDKITQTANESNDQASIQESVDWLSVNVVPWELVIEHWKKTCKIRCDEFKNSKDKNLTNFYKSWKLYEHVQGYELISIDFEYLKLTKMLLNIELWKKFFDILRKNSQVNQRDSTAVSLEQKLASKNISENAMVLMSLSLIAHLYPPKQMKKINKESFRPSIGLSKESIFKIASTPSDMLLVKEKARVYASERKMPLQPYIIIIGSVEDVQDTYVCIDERLYKVRGVLHALDTCFKAFHVFDLEYPTASTHLWLLIQKGIYQIHLPYDQEIASIQHGPSKLVDKMSTKKHAADDDSKDEEDEEKNEEDSDDDTESENDDSS